MELDIQSPSKATVIVLDLGTKVVRCCVLSIKGGHITDVLACFEVPSKGIENGNIVNFQSLKTVILAIMKKTAEYTDDVIEEAFINISSNSFHAFTVNQKVEISGRQVSAKDVDRIERYVPTNTDPSKSSIIVHTIPVSYKLDNIQNIETPLGMFGDKLEATMFIIETYRSSLMNIERCLSQCSISLLGCSLTSYTSGFSVVGDKDCLTTLVMDIGYMSTTVTVFYNRKPILSRYITLGIYSVIRDVACGLQLSVNDAEHLVIHYGVSAFTQDIDIEKSIEIADRKFSIVEVVEIIKPRVEEILEIVQDATENHSLNHLIINGQAGKLAGMKELAEEIFHCPVSIGNPELRGTTYDSSHASLIGAVKYFEQYISSARTESKYKKYFKKIMSFMSY